MNVKSTKKKNQVVTANIFEQQELLKKAEVIKKSLAASTWHELETNGKFDKYKKLSFISDDMLILVSPRLTKSISFTFRVTVVHQMASAIRKDNLMRAS